MAVRRLRRKGFRRVALVHKDADGSVETFRRSKNGIERKLLSDHARWLNADETVLILKARIELMQLPMAVLRESGEIPPVIFVLNPGRIPLIDVPASLEVPLSSAQARERAEYLAGRNRVGIERPRNIALFERMKQARKWIALACSDLSAAAALGQRITPIAQWILDNEYIIESNVRDIQRNLTRRFYRELPALESAPHQGLPRIYQLAGELVASAGLRIDRENIVAFVEAYQSVRTLTTAELWAIPQMLRTALIENILDLTARSLEELRDREIADFWAHRLITAGRRDPNRLYGIMSELTETHPAPSPCFAFQLIDHLYGEEEAAALVRSWLERVFGHPLDELNAREQDRQGKGQISIGNAFTSLRHLTLLDWREIFEQVSRVEQVLRLDPAGVYAEMDFATRDRYRRTIERSARRSGRTEERTARDAVDLAAGAAREEALDERRIHVGYYLVGEGNGAFERLVGSSEPPAVRLRRWASRRHAAVYLSAVAIFSALFLSLIVLLGLQGQPSAIRILIVLLSLIPASQLAVEVVNYLVMRVFPPCALSKMDFEASGIPDAFRTLVVVPMMLTDERTLDRQVEALEIRYLANREDNLLFSLFTDFTDSDHPRDERDELLLRRTIAGLTALNERYGDERFLLFHRERTWSDSERKYIGWERKRGKLEELNRLIDGTRPESAPPLVYLGDPERLADVRFVITLDSDTQLPSGTARRMIETLAHPLNQPRFDADGRVAAGSYTIIQPRVSPSLPSTSGSPFSRLFSFAVGIDPYTRVVSDVNQDLAGEGSYHGKGIYDVRAFSRVLSGMFPEQRLLSHDLIEGAHVRVGLASDIELLDEFPQDYLTYAARQHRWIRGDWQIADWILPRVPRADGRRAANRLSSFERWKILDNLRRSLLPVSSLALLSAAWLTATGAGWIAGLIVAAQLLFAVLAQPFTMATTRHGLKSLSLSEIGHNLLRTLAEASLIPHQSFLSADAVLRVWYRRLVSHRNLLEWTVRRRKHPSALTHFPTFMRSMGLIGLLGIAAGWALLRFAPASVPFAAPWLMLWMLSPVTGWLLNRRPRSGRRTEELSSGDLLTLRKIARRTWRYYAEFVSPETSWLPPDNYQVSHQNMLAMRTSPTNIGLWMLSAAAARDFGYLSGDQVVDVLSRSMETIAGLERFEGHLLNWYDIAKLEPLEPRYVSTVDSGNLLGSLWSLEHGLEALIDRPVLDGSFSEGLRDTAEVLRETVERKGKPQRDSVRYEAALLSSVGTLIDACRTPPYGAAAALDLLRQAERYSRETAGAIAADDRMGGGAGLLGGQNDEPGFGLDRDPRSVSRMDGDPPREVR